jgi:uncharacterized protein YidB (DUF937 family)
VFRISSNGEEQRFVAAGCDAHRTGGGRVGDFGKEESAMGLLDGLLGGGQPQRRPGLGDTIAAGVILALLVKGIRQYQATHGGQPAPSGRSFEPQGQAAPEAGGMLGGLGGLLGGGGLSGSGMGGGLGGLLGGLGGAGALGALINRFQQSGFGQQAQSWVSTGQNQPIAPHEVENALGDKAVDELQQQTGMPRQQLLSELAHELPQAINEATPQGRVPQSDEELHEVARQPASNA